MLHRRRHQHHRAQVHFPPQKSEPKVASPVAGIPPRATEAVPTVVVVTEIDWPSSRLARVRRPVQPATASAALASAPPEPSPRQISRAARIAFDLAAAHLSVAHRSPLSFLAKRRGNPLGGLIKLFRGGFAFSLTNRDQNGPLPHQVTETTLMPPAYRVRRLVLALKPVHHRKGGTLPPRRGATFRFRERTNPHPVGVAVARDGRHDGSRPSTR